MVAPGRLSAADGRAGRRLALLAALLVVPLAALVRADWTPLHRLDTALLPSLHGVGRDLALVLTQLGAPPLLELAAVLLAVLLRGRRALFVLVVVLGAELVSTLSKHAVGRVRPCLGVVGCPGSTSFPSGHALGAAAFWTAMAVLLLPLWGRWAWALAVGVPLLVAATRVLLGVHYASDVVAGLLVGWSWAAASTAVFAQWRDERAGRDVPLEEGI